MSSSLKAPWTVAGQAALSMGFSIQEFWSGLPFPPPVALPNPGIKAKSPVPPVLAGGFFITELPGKPYQVYTTLYKINNKHSLYSTGNSTQYSAITYMGKESEKVYTCVCITESLRCTPETNTTFQIHYASIKIFLKMKIAE